MENTIKKEFERASSYFLKEFEWKGKKLVEISYENVAIVEAMLFNDNAYRRTMDKEAAPQNKRKKYIKYKGSSAFWMEQLSQALLTENKSSSKYSYKTIIQNAVEAVDRENSTHINSDKSMMIILV